MPTLAYDRRALQDLERFVESLLEEDPSAAEDVLVIGSALELLKVHPLIGRITRGDLRELVISHGRTGYLALYHFRRAADHVQVRAIRHQREAGFEDPEFA